MLLTQHKQEAVNGQCKKSLYANIFFAVGVVLWNYWVNNFFNNYFNKIGYAADHKLILIWEPDSVTKKIAKYL